MTMHMCVIVFTKMRRFHTTLYLGTDSISHLCAGPDFVCIKSICNIRYRLVINLPGVCNYNTTLALCKGHWNCLLHIMLRNNQFRLLLMLPRCLSNSHIAANIFIIQIYFINNAIALIVSKPKFSKGTYWNIQYIFICHIYPHTSRKLVN